MFEFVNLLDKIRSMFATYVNFVNVFERNKEKNCALRCNNFAFKKSSKKSAKNVYLMQNLIYKPIWILFLFENEILNYKDSKN